MIIRKIKTSEMKTKKAQAQIIVTVLLILIALAGVAVVAGFVIKMVRDNLASTDCFKTAGQLTIKQGQATYYVPLSVGKDVYLSIERGQEDFNLTGVLISIGNDQTAKTFKIIGGQNATDDAIAVVMFGGEQVIELPGIGERRTYIISSAMENVDSAMIAPIIENNKQCEKSDEVMLTSKS